MSKTFVEIYEPKHDDRRRVTFHELEPGKAACEVLGVTVLVEYTPNKRAIFAEFDLSPDCKPQNWFNSFNTMLCWVHTSIMETRRDPIIVEFLGQKRTFTYGGFRWVCGDLKLTNEEIGDGEDWTAEISKDFMFEYSRNHPTPEAALAELLTKIEENLANREKEANQIRLWLANPE